MNISVIGAGYVGLTTAGCLAELGHNVFCAESDAQNLAKLQAGVLPCFEPHLEEMVVRGRAANRLNFGSTDDAIDHGRAIFICVGTPPLDNGEADLSYIEAVARSIAMRAHGYRLVIEKSTVPVQTGRQLRKQLAQHKNRHFDYDVASNPEFLREGSAVENFFHPDRIVVGVESPRAEECLREIYAPMFEGKINCPAHVGCHGRKDIKLLVTDTNSAELIKHASNSFLAMKISFINLIADLCEVAGADVTKVAEGIGLDPRIGASFLQPGIGFGGFCFPKDLQAFVRIGAKFNCDFSLLEEVEKINLSRVNLFVEKIKNELWVLRGKKIAVWGLSFKPNTDDIRFAPSLTLIKRLASEGAIIEAYDPQAMDKAKEELPNISYGEDPYDTAKDADLILLVTEWDEFRNLDWRRLASLVARPLVIDGRNFLPGKEIAANGFSYVGIGGVSEQPDPANLIADVEQPISPEVAAD
jgi:UDPglucose 6-dehydrogenase